MNKLQENHPQTYQWICSVCGLMAGLGLIVTACGMAEYEEWFLAGLSLLGAALLCAVNFVIACAFYTVATEKGYSSSMYFWFPFVFSFVGYLLVVALPDHSQPLYEAPNQQPTPFPNSSTVKEAVPYTPKSDPVPLSTSKNVPTSPSVNRKGDLKWFCPECGRLNSKQDEKCAGCFVRRPKDVNTKTNLWQCKFCNYENPAWVNKCQGCGKETVSTRTVVAQKKTETWICTECGRSNANQVEQCAGCSANRPKEKNPQTESWQCRFCNYENPAWVNKCQGCGK